MRTCSLGGGPSCSCPRTTSRPSRGARRCPGRASCARPRIGPRGGAAPRASHLEAHARRRRALLHREPARRHEPETYALRQRDPDAWDTRPFLQRIAAVREAYASLGPNEAEAALLHDWSTGLQQARERLAAFAERLAERRTGERRTGGAAPRSDPGPRGARTRG